ncbi:MAG: hypothetical protein KAK01_01925, partial [Candidatus Marinimicrobia bacterium]|nr:hypothetical protein [Candidatus Neomarinimicrobiota bacterium]
MRATFAKGIYITGAVNLINNTIYDTYYGVWLDFSAVGSVIKNNIISNNNYAFYNNAANGLTSYNDLFGNTYGNYSSGAVYKDPGIGEISLDPLYRDAASEDFRLQASSPCIDTGDPGSDLDPDGTRADMGAFYFIDLPPEIPTGLTAEAANSSIKLTWNANSESDLAKYRIYRDISSPATILIDSVVGSPPDTFYTDTGLTNDQTYYYRITALDQGANESGFSAEVTAIPDTILYTVKTDGSGDFTTIQLAINATNNGDTVLVHPSTYVENINFNGKNIVVGSLFLTTQDISYISSTIIDGNQAGSVVTMDGNNTQTIIGFSIINGNSWGDYSRSGGGIKISGSPSIKNLIIMNNIAEDGSGNMGEGGGIYMVNASPKIDNVVIINNSAMEGSAICCNQESMPVINNILVYNNSSTGGGTLSFAYLNQVELTNATIVDNNITSGAIINVSNSSLEVVNSIVRNNLFTTFKFEQTVAGDFGINCSYSNINEIIAGEGNINTDPLFVDASGYNYRLSDYSPCIGAGTITGVPTTDIEGNPRPNPAGSNPDIGAYENPLAEPLHNSFIHVATTGNDAGSVGLESAPFRYIQSAIDAA